jgi:hypothetical protein
MPSSPRVQARVAGIAYLVTHVTAVTAVLAYGAGAVPAGVTLELMLAFGCVATGVLVGWLLRAAGPVRGATFALLRAVEAAVILAGALPLLASTWLPSGNGFAEAAREMHTASFLLGQGLVISVNTVVVAWLLWDSRATPRALALLGALGGVVVLISNLAQLWSVIPLNGTLAGAAAAPVFAFEVWFALHLIVVGLPHRQADAPQ